MAALHSFSEYSSILPENSSASMTIRDRRQILPLTASHIRIFRNLWKKLIQNRLMENGKLVYYAVVAGICAHSIILCQIKAFSSDEKVNKKMASHTNDEPPDFKWVRLACCCRRCRGRIAVIFCVREYANTLYQICSFMMMSAAYAEMFQSIRCSRKQVKSFK